MSRESLELAIDVDLVEPDISGGGDGFLKRRERRGLRQFLGESSASTAGQDSASRYAILSLVSLSTEKNFVWKRYNLDLFSLSFVEYGKLKKLIIWEFVFHIFNLCLVKFP